MGLLEYQAMPSLREVHLVFDQPKTWQVVWFVRAGGMDSGHSIKYKITPYAG
jgi:hypothetical protein